MSNLHLGIEKERIPFCSPLYIPPILLIDLASSSSVKEIPRIPSTRDFFTSWILEVPSRLHSIPSQVFTLTDSTFPPIICSCKHTNISDDSHALESKPVTSTNRSLVFVVTVVCSPFIIGGNDNTSSFESRIIGTFSISSSRCE